MNENDLQSIEEIKTFLEATQHVRLSLPRSNRYAWIARTLKQVNYFGLSKKDKGIILDYLSTVSHYSRQQLTRLIKQYKTQKWIGRKATSRCVFPRRYTRDDILLLLETDRHHGCLSGPATKRLFERAYTLFSDASYERLSSISVSHIYNLRKSKLYLSHSRQIKETTSRLVQIGERRKPFPDNRPGYIRIDTVHQGDRGKQKGVYHIRLTK